MKFSLPVRSLTQKLLLWFLTYVLTLKHIQRRSNVRNVPPAALSPTSRHPTTSLKSLRRKGKAIDNGVWKARNTPKGNRHNTASPPFLFSQRDTIPIRLTNPKPEHKNKKAKHKNELSSVILTSASRMLSKIGIQKPSFSYNLSIILYHTF